MTEFVDKPSRYEEKGQFTAKALNGRYNALQRLHSLLIHTTNFNGYKKYLKKIQSNVFHEKFDLFV